MNIKALTFSITGTVMDWYSNMYNELDSFWANNNITNTDCDNFIRLWKKKCNSITHNSKKQDIPFKSIDEVHRFVLDEVLSEFNISLTNAEKDTLCSFWYKMQPWKDAPLGIEMLRSKFFVSTLTTLSIPLVSRTSKNASINWDLILSCQILDSYKLLPETYLKAAELMNYKPEEIMMIASHSLDLAGAQAAGFRTGFISRLNEWGDNKGTIDTENQYGDPSMNFDIYADNIIDLYQKINAME